MPLAIVAPVIGWIFAIARLNGIETRSRRDRWMKIPEASVGRFVSMAVGATIFGVVLYLWRAHSMARLVGCYGRVIETNAKELTLTYRLDGRTHTATEPHLKTTSKNTPISSSILVVVDPREPTRIRYVWPREEPSADQT
jgi:hypothetical protein